MNTGRGRSGHAGAHEAHGATCGVLCWLQVRIRNDIQYQMIVVYGMYDMCRDAKNIT